MGRLTDIDLRNWIRAGKPTAKADGEGLTFTLSAKGTAAWTLRYSHGGKAKELTLGRYPDMSRPNALMVRILLATGARIGELVQAEWVHLDFERAEWTIPPKHSKTKKGFVISLPPMVAGWFAELQSMAFGSRYVMPIRTRFNGKEGDAHMEPVTLNAALVTLAKRLGKKCRRFTPHDLRSTCRSHLGALGIDVLIAERCLNHSLGGLVATYDKHDYLTERRRALELWAAKLASIENGEAFNVVALRRA